MDVHVIKMPDIGEGIAEVELVAWHVQLGEDVVEDQALADVMTDKASVEVPSPVAGKVQWLGGKVGEIMAVGAELIHIAIAGEGNACDGDTATHDALPTPPPPAQTSVPSAAAQCNEHAPEEKPTASPAVRRQALEMGIDLRSVRGSGAQGRILSTDLQAFAALSGGAGCAHEQDGRSQIAVIGLRRHIAQKMTESKRNIPHFSYVEEVDITELETLRAQLNAQWSASHGKLTLLPFLARAIVLALRDAPHINAHYDGQEQIITQYQAVHLGVAMQTEAGLMVPVLRHAENMDLWRCAAEIARLTQAARSGKAERDELSGSTITLTSLGALGGIVSTPVINSPEVAIIGVNRMVEKPVVREGAIVVRKTMNLSSSFDHRVVDGMHAASFIQNIRKLLEYPALLFAAPLIKAS